MPNANYSVTLFAEDWSIAEWNNGKIDFSTFTTQSGDRIPFLNWYTNQTGNVSPYISQSIQCLSQDADNTVQMANPYTFNNVAYGDNAYIGVNIGTYKLTGITATHPLYCSPNSSPQII